MYCQKCGCEVKSNAECPLCVRKRKAQLIDRLQTWAPILLIMLVIGLAILLQFRSKTNISDVSGNANSSSRPPLSSTDITLQVEDQLKERKLLSADTEAQRMRRAADQVAKARDIVSYKNYYRPAVDPAKVLQLVCEVPSRSKYYPQAKRLSEQAIRIAHTGILENLADSMQDQYLQKGLDVYVDVHAPDDSGEEKPVLYIRWVLMTRVTAYKLQHNELFMKGLARLGVWKIVLGTDDDNDRWFVYPGKQYPELYRLDFLPFASKTATRCEEVRSGESTIVPPLRFDLPQIHLPELL